MTSKSKEDMEDSEEAMSSRKIRLKQQDEKFRKAMIRSPEGRKRFPDLWNDK